MAAVIGRERELAAVGRLLERGSSGFAALVLEGEAGIGKTTVWREAVRVAEDAGYEVLGSRPAEAETALAFASLADLLEPVADHRLDELPEPQRDALEAALLRRRAVGRRADARTVGAAVRSILRVAGERPLLVALDDAQWIDRSSDAALAYALRRVDPTARLGVLVAVRVGDRAPPAPRLVAALESGVERVRLGPLSLSALYHVIHSELGIVLPRPTLQGIEKASGGNPLFAVELARALEEVGERLVPGEPLPIPDSLGDLLTHRIAKLSSAVREALLACALLSKPTTDMLDRVLGPTSSSLLQSALQAGVVELRGSDVRFDHPLLASAVANSVVPARRRAMHRRLAEAVDSDEQRARHLALAAEGPSETVASILEGAAESAFERGASDDSAELWELSCRFTPEHDPDALARRRVELARVLFHAGDAREATRILDEVVDAGTAGPIRARALELRAQIHWVSGTARDAEACCEEALAHVGDDDRLRVRVLVTLARVTVGVEPLYQRSQAALDFLESLAEPDPGLLSEALVGLAGAEFYLGRGIRSDVVERALALERVAPPRNVGDRMSAALGAYLKYDGDFDGARRWLEATRRAAIDEGDEGSLPYALSHLPQLELWTGNWAAAEERALEHLELAERTGQALERLTAIYSLALVEAHQGRVEQARARLEPALAEAEGGEPWNVYQLLSALGFAELAVGRFPEAVAALGRAFEIYEATGSQDTPGVFENYPEALVGIGDLRRAHEVVELYEQRARASRKALAIAPALRCRALVLAAEQRLDEAATALDESLEQHERVAMPFSRARTLLVAGQVRRRRGERRAAKEALGEAAAVFEKLGAPLWAQRARSELGRVPIRRPRSTAGLTATERRVAELVAEGRTNREVAQLLFISEKTVEANLTRIYRKLGVRSRTALAARLATSEGVESAIP